jgi:hypothetical protein
MAGGFVRLVGKESRLESARFRVRSVDTLDEMDRVVAKAKGVAAERVPGGDKYD